MKRFCMIFAALAAASFSIACVQMPTERASIVDARPQISFRVIGEVDSLRVFIDGLDMGPINQYLDLGSEKGAHSLRILPGSHILRVENDNSAVIHEEKLYIGDGVSRVIQIP
jgi:hypothetical protein